MLARLLNLIILYKNTLMRGLMDTHNQPPKLMDRVKAIMRVKRYSPRTVKTYCYWVRYFIRFNGLRHPASMGGPEVKAFLEHLAVRRHVAAAKQDQTLNALVFSIGMY
ncbi:hypothetical protein DEJ73_09230 [Chromohalobacter salexigens]|nr:hypothetical protein [Chromohalobacter salexigens]